MTQIPANTNPSTQKPPLLPQGETLNSQLGRFTLILVKAGIRRDEAVREFEKNYLEQLLIEHRGNRCKAARAAGMHRNTLSRNIEEHQIDLKRILLMCGGRKRPQPQDRQPAQSALMGKLKSA
jgi:DNA-binding NtrC family response regulator